MQDKRIKLIYFSMGGSEVKQLCLGWKKIIGILSLSFVFVLLFVFLILQIFTDFFHNWQVARLSKSNSQLEELLTEMGQKINKIETKVKYLEKEDDDLRVFVDLPVIDSDTRELGIGGYSEDTYANYTSIENDALDQAIKIQRMIENMEQRVTLASDSRNDIMNKYNEDLRQLKSTPSIRPVLGGRVTASYGLRLDPFVDKYRTHEGLDISAPRGTDIHATADGRVVEVQSKYEPNKDFGKYIVIDHGYGYQTRYAHLHKILVTRGQKVKRYDVIGKVGDTGRSTGPHLHYEVLVNNKKKDPGKYIID